jgi:putative membrane protein
MMKCRTMPAPRPLTLETKILFAGSIVMLIFSGIYPHDMLTWLLETAPIMMGLPILLYTGRRFPLTPLLCWLLLVHAGILALGGHYTYALVPPGFWMQDLFDLSRNHYDRLGHFAQGFVPAILVREILSRRSPLAGSRWQPVLTVCGCLAFSAFYEMIEWWGALIFGGAADSFLGTQGDPWDTQWDMFLALIGATAAVTALASLHDRQIARLTAE